MNAWLFGRIPAVVLALGGCFTATALGIGFVNGGFESPALAPGIYSVLAPPTGPTSWILLNGDASINRNGARGYGNAHSGSQYVFLPESASQAAITQVMNNLQVGVNYHFSIWVAAFNNTASATECYVRVGRSSTGDPLLGILVHAPANATVVGSATSPWTQYTANFTATTSTETFEIATLRLGGDLAFAALDDVSLSYGFNGYPTVRIANSRKKAITVTKKKYSLAGTAQAKIPIQQVRIRVGSHQTVASGTNVWLGKVRLKKGRNRIAVTAIDAAGTVSQPARLTVILGS